MIERFSPLARYSAAAGLAVAAQLARLPLHPPTLIPYITYVPFVVLGVWLGWGPGLLTMTACVVESLYFAAEPVRSFSVSGKHNWFGLALLTLTGLVANVEVERLRRSQAALRLAVGEIQKDNSLLDAVFEAQSDGVFVIDAGGQIIRTNPAAKSQFGFEAAGASIGEFFQRFPLAGGLDSSLTRRALLGELNPRAEQRIGQRVLETSSAPMRGPEGKVTGAVTISRDITDRKRAEEDFRATHSELNAIYDNAPVVLFVVNEDLRIEKLNARAAQLAGQEAGEILGLRPGDAMGCANAKVDAGGCGSAPACRWCPVRAIVLETLRSGARQSGTDAWVPWAEAGRDDPMCLLISTAALQFGSSRKVLVCAQEITELKGAQLELQRDAALINLSHDAIITASEDRKVRSWNQGATEIYGWTEGEARGQRLPDLLQTDSTMPLSEVDKTLLREGHWEGEIRHCRRDGRDILIESRQVLLCDTGGALCGILEINRDITERRRAEDSLRETVRELKDALAEKTVLLKEVHHRVKNNLAVISSLLSLKAGASASDETRLALGQSQQRVHSMALIHELLYGSEHLDRIHFPDYVQQLVRGLYASFLGEGGHVSIDMNIDPVDLGIERAVPCALILNELLSNAFKHAFGESGAGKILVSFHRTEPGWFALAVEDNGAGIPEGRLESQDTKSLGLRIVRILAKQMEGTIQQEPYAGTRLVLRFPQRSTSRLS